MVSPVSRHVRRVRLRGCAMLTKKHCAPQLHWKMFSDRFASRWVRAIITCIDSLRMMRLLDVSRQVFPRSRVRLWLAPLRGVRFDVRNQRQGSVTPCLARQWPVAHVFELPHGSARVALIDRGAVVCFGVTLPRAETDRRLIAVLRDEALAPAAIVSIQEQVQQLMTDASRTTKGLAGAIGGEQGAVGQAPVEALAIKDTDLDFRHVEPTGAFRRISFTPHCYDGVTVWGLRSTSTRIGCSKWAPSGPICVSKRSRTVACCSLLRRCCVCVTPMTRSSKSANESNRNGE